MWCRTNYRIRRLRLSRLLLVQEARHPSPRIIRTFGISPMAAAPSVNDINKRAFYSGLIVGAVFVLLSGIIYYMVITDAFLGVVRFRFKNLPAVEFFRRDDPGMFWTITVFNLALASFFLYNGGTMLYRTRRAHVAERR